MSEIPIILKIENSKKYLLNLIKTKTDREFDLEFKENPYSISIILKNKNEKIRLKTIMINSNIWWGDFNSNRTTISEKLLNKLSEKVRKILENE